MKKIVALDIYGSGISGLLCGYFALKRGFKKISIVSRGKGLIQTVNTPWGMAELAANSILENSSVTQLLKELGIPYQYYRSVGKKKYIYHRGKAKRWPLSPFETLVSLPKLYRLGSKHKALKPKPMETMADWVKRGPGEKIGNRLVLTGLKGIYGPDTENLSSSLVLSSLFQNSVDSGSKGSLSFDKGMGFFIKCLESFLFSKGVKFYDQDPSDKGDVSIVCTPSWSLPEVARSHSELLSKIKYQDVTTTTVFLDKDLELPFEGFGCLFQENEGVLGVIKNTDLFDGRAVSGLISETWILDGRKYNREDQVSDVMDFRQDKFSRRSKPLGYKWKHWERAFPKYDLNLERSLRNLNENRMPNVYFFGNWTGALGIGRLIKSCPHFIEDIVKDLSGKRNI